MPESRTILLVEPEERLRKLFKRSWLERKTDLIILAAESGSVAQRLLRESWIDAIVTDNFMPEMSGLELIRWIRQQPSLAHLPVIVVSMYSQYVDQAQRVIQPLHQVGADSVVLKFSFQEVLSTLERWNWQRPECPEPAWAFPPNGSIVNN